MVICSTLSFKNTPSITVIIRNAVLSIILVIIISTSTMAQSVASNTPFIDVTQYIGSNSIGNCGASVSTDIGAQVNAAGAATGWKGTFYIPAGTYTETTSICLPLSVQGKYKLVLDPATTIIFSGTGYFIETYEVTPSPTDPNIQIHGGIVAGSPSSAGGIHLLPAPGGHLEIEGMDISGFSNGDAITLEGAILTNIEHNRISGNLNGIHLVPTRCQTASPVQVSGQTPYYPCGAGVGGSSVGYATNANHIVHNVIGGNSHWGIFEDLSNLTFPALNNQYANNDMELNGTAGSSYGAIQLCGSQGSIVQGNYFEGAPRNVTFCGAVNTVGTQIVDNYFTGASSTPYEIELNAAISATIQGNTEYTAGSTPPSTCFVNRSGWGALNSIFIGNVVSATNKWCANGTPITNYGGESIFAIDSTGVYTQGIFHQTGYLQ